MTGLFDYKTKLKFRRKPPPMSTVNYNLKDFVDKPIPYATHTNHGWNYHHDLASAKMSLHHHHGDPSRRADTSWARRYALAGLYRWDAVRNGWQLIFVTHYDLSREDRIELLRLITK